EMSNEERAAFIKEHPAYGRVICRCETITEGEIIDALHRPIVPCSIDGVKRRCNAGMGRCQGGFCGPRVQEIISRELNIPQEEVLQDKNGSVILFGKTKEGGQDNA
ncbi:MAG: (2Fe-2S)-binding protein, partial [Erysipelotrichaceae bacterium]|nr:(2Fe-2S)-binding protein [Erysipelotrichaceae bacterium]